MKRRPHKYDRKKSKYQGRENRNFRSKDPVSQGQDRNLVTKEERTGHSKDDPDTNYQGGSG